MSKKHVIHHPAKTDDVFVEKTLEASIWARQHKRILTGLIAIAVIAVAAGVYYMNYSAQLQDRAAGRLTEIRQTVVSGNRPLAIRDLEAYLRTFGSTPSGKEARILLTQAYIEQGDAPKAIATAKPLADDLDEPLGPTAAFLTAAAYEVSNQKKNAENLYLRLGDDARMPFQRREALVAAARLRLDAGNIRGAEQLYEKLLGTLPDTVPERQVYEMRLAEIKAKANAPATGKS
jgi:predicted negative regulator of RcsB-dependent stress response